MQAWISEIWTTGWHQMKIWIWWHACIILVLESRHWMTGLPVYLWAELQCCHYMGIPWQRLLGLWLSQVCGDKPPVMMSGSSICFMSLCGRSTWKQKWRVRTHPQVSLPWLMLLQNSVWWLLGNLRSMGYHASRLEAQDARKADRLHFHLHSKFSETIKTCGPTLSVEEM